MKYTSTDPSTGEAMPDRSRCLYIPASAAHAALFLSTSGAAGSGPHTATVIAREVDLSII